MAVQFRKDRNKWRTYWRNPFTGKMESKFFDTELDALRHDSLIKHRLKFERNTFIQEEKETSINENSLTLEQAHFLYLREKSFSDRELTWSVGCMKRIHAMFGNKLITDITREDLEKARAMELADDKIKPITAKEHLTVFRAILNWCVERGYLESAPRFPRMPEAQAEHFIPPTQDEIARIYNVAAPHLQRCILIACNTGVRVGPSELFGIKWQDIDFSSAVLKLHAAKKNKKEPIREIPLRQDLLAKLQEWYLEDTESGLAIEYVIHYKGNPIRSIKRAWATALRVAGIHRKIRLYDQRHMFGSECLAAGIDIGTVAKLMGHTSPLMLLKHYQHVADKQKRNAVESIPTINIAGHTARAYKNA